MNSNYTYRVDEKELMELPGADPVEVAKSLEYLHFVNRHLGGYSVLRRGLDNLSARRPRKKIWRILDLGCGDGRLLQEIQKWAHRKGIQVKLTGLDISETSLQKAKEQSALKGVSWLCADALDPSVDFSEFDLATGTLFFHHLTDDQIAALLSRLNNSNVSVLINDLHRSRFAGILFVLFARLSRAPRMARLDGQLSIHRGFSRAELQEIYRQSGYLKQRIQWRWAYRYLILLWNE